MQHRDRVVEALREIGRDVCETCLADKLSLPFEAVLFTTLDLEDDAQYGLYLAVRHGMCSLCGRLDRVIRLRVPQPTTSLGEPICPVCDRAVARDEGVAVTEIRAIIHVHMFCLDVFRAHRGRGPSL